MVAAGSKYMDMHVDLMSWNSTQHPITVLSVPVKASVTRLHFCVCFQAYFLNMSGWLPTPPSTAKTHPRSKPVVLGGHWSIHALLCYIFQVCLQHVTVIHTHTHTHRVQTWLPLSALSSSEVSIPGDPWGGDRKREREGKFKRRRKGEMSLCREVKIKDMQSEYYDMSR